MNRNILIRYFFTSVTLMLAGVVLVGCNLPNQASDATPTLDTTQAYQTVQARLTEAIARSPSPTVTSSPSPIPSATATQNPAEVTPSPTTGAVSTAAPSATSSGGQSSCDAASPGSPIDVTVPDDTVMAPEQSFSKTWRLKNAGTCTWNSDYAVVYFSGDRMGASDRVPLTGSVAPGETVDLTVDMVAPVESGTYQGNWKLRNANNQLFGIGSGEGLPFYVRIVVGSGVTLTPTGSPSQTATPTEVTGTSGSVILFPADRIDLDNILVNSGGADLAYLQDDSDSTLYLTPLDNAQVAIYGGFIPEEADCQAANLSGGRLAVADLETGTYLCHKTNEGAYGWMRLTGFNPDNSRLDLDVYTWIAP
jgi:hypothetical protein